jgi:hypothetical protein
MTDTEPSPLPPIAAAPLGLVLLPGDGTDADAELLQAWIAHLDGLDRDYDLLVTENNPSLTHSRLRTIRPAGPGAGAALRAGLSATHHPLVCTVPLDRRYPPESLKALLERIDTVHLVVGYRTGTPVPVLLRWLGRLYRWTLRIAFGILPEPLPGWLGGRQRCVKRLFQLLFGLRVHDPTCPVQLARREVLARLPVQSDGIFVHVEVLAKANFLGCIMDEVPIHWPTASVPERLRPMLPDLRCLLQKPDFGTAPVLK